MKRFQAFIGLIIFIIISFIIFIFHVKLPCLFKQITGINCPACGMTRAFIALLNGNVIDAFRYNILSIPLAILLVVVVILLIYDLIKNSNKAYSFCLKLLDKYYIYIIVLLIISFVKNLFYSIG